MGHVGRMHVGERAKGCCLIAIDLFCEGAVARRMFAWVEMLKKPNGGKQTEKEGQYID